VSVNRPEAVHLKPPSESSTSMACPCQRSVLNRPQLAGFKPTDDTQSRPDLYIPLALTPRPAEHYVSDPLITALVVIASR
jgi:hypothetical protein